MLTKLYVMDAEDDAEPRRACAQLRFGKPKGCVGCDGKGVGDEDFLAEAHNESGKSVGKRRH